eukprot:scaffold236_cov419-Prasinococcus_capsulatus_cf.AAC.16
MAAMTRVTCCLYTSANVWKIERAATVAGVDKCKQLNTSRKGSDQRMIEFIVHNLTAAWLIVIHRKNGFVEPIRFATVPVSLLPPMATAMV